MVTAELHLTNGSHDTKKKNKTKKHKKHIVNKSSGWTLFI